MAVNHENAALIRRWVEIINERRLDELFDVWSEGYTSALVQLDGRPFKSIRLAAGSATAGARAGGP